MYQRDHHRGGQPPQTAPRRAASPIAALQRAVGNRGMTRVLARDAKRGTFQNSVQLGPIEITGGNVAEWITQVPDD
jgi:hypothetical protein